MLTRVFTAILAALLIVLVLSAQAYGHGVYAWIMQYNNAKGNNCCDFRDATPISHEVANSARVGSVVVAPFPHGAEPIKVNIIHPTRDPEGRPWITRYGCLFRWSGG